MSHLPTPPWAWTRAAACPCTGHCTQTRGAVFSARAHQQSSMHTKLYIVSSRGHGVVHSQELACNGKVEVEVVHLIPLETEHQSPGDTRVSKQPVVCRRPPLAVNPLTSSGSSGRPPSPALQSRSAGQTGSCLQGSQTDAQCSQSVTLRLSPASMCMCPSLTRVPQLEHVAVRAPCGGLG